MNELRINELYEEAVMDCYDEDEVFSGIFYTLAEQLSFPLMASLIGETVKVTDIDSASSPRRGIVATVKRNGKAYQANLANLTFVEPDESTQELLAVHAKWMS